MYKTGLCVLDCPDSCSIEVKVKDGHLVSIDGDTRNPLTEGYICGKVRSQMNEHLYGEDRVRHPLIRCGTKGDASFERVSWDQALSAIAERFNAIRDNYGGLMVDPMGCFLRTIPMPGISVALKHHGWPAQFAPLQAPARRVRCMARCRVSVLRIMLKREPLLSGVRIRQSQAFT